MYTHTSVTPVGKQMLLHQDISPPFPLISRAHGETQEPALVTLPTAPATVLWHHQCCLPSASTSGSCSEPGVAGRHALKDRKASRDKEEEVVRMANNSSALPRVTFETPEKPGEESSHRRLGKLTIKYNRKDLQRWLDLEEWINARLQELYQYPLREKTDAEVPGPVIDLEDLLEVPNEEQKLKLQEILHECSSPTEDFITELLSRLKGLRRITNPQKRLPHQ
ncbi:LOW QUALITY PROTEIN: protein phosphatase 1 regulatory subunit 14D [Coturnix japonica]|uniref:LOW QUALITY PROTEIN: protein phosphatase 1 regulatory subunit 14D n=1 Tax=Coturnix japonica TaxID=93934 RepID=UPI0013A5CB55|nr:LOW QUALITY PROTEIN: protein phosphatase 1 regulatory subunit 14D [Coturnix japonica]